VKTIANKYRHAAYHNKHWFLFHAVHNCPGGMTDAVARHVNCPGGMTDAVARHVSFAQITCSLYYDYKSVI